MSYTDDTSKVVKHKRCVADVSINVGYSYFYENWYLGVGGEVSFGKNGEKFVTFDEDYPTESKISGFSSEARLKGGYYFKDLNAVVYGIAGLKWRNVEMQYNFSYRTVSAIGSKAKLSTPLYAVGIGIERPIYKKVSFSVEYEYIWRSSKDTSEVKPNGTPFRFYIKQRLKEHSFKVGIKYHI